MLYPGFQLFKDPHVFCEYMSIICSTDETLNVNIEDFVKDGNKYYGKVLNGHKNLYVQSCIMEKTHMDENDILLTKLAVSLSSKWFPL